MRYLSVVLFVFVFSAGAADFEFNTAGPMGTTPYTGGTHNHWGEWFVGSLQNNSGHALHLLTLGFPCSGPPTGSYGWLVWTNVGGLVAPAGEASSADFYGAFTPLDPDSSSNPPTTYTYIDVSSENIVIPAGNYFCFGYDVTGHGGHVLFSGVDTWAWYNNTWSPDQSWDRTAVMELTADYTATLEPYTWASVKASFQL